MKEVRIYQVVDQVSESVISTFIAPNVKYAKREFKKMFSDPKIKDSIDPDDFFLVCSDAVKIAESYSDFPFMNEIHDDDSIVKFEEGDLNEA